MPLRYVLAVFSVAFVVLWALDQWAYGGEHMRIFVRSLRQIGYV